MRRNWWVAAALAAVGVSGTAALPAGALPPGAVTTHCRVHMQGSWDTGEQFRAEVHPGLARPDGRGPVQHAVPDGTEIRFFADTLLCRRDGGRVPAHGGANIADATGDGTLRRADGTEIPVLVQVHVEDRGEGEYNREDYWAIRAVDADGNEAYFNANFLAAGTVRLTPVLVR